MVPSRLDPALVRKSAIIVAGIALIEALVLIVFHSIFVPPVLQHLERVPFFAWPAAVLVAVAYIWYAAYGLPTVRRLLFTVAPVAVLGLVIAVPSSILEEIFFRQGLMNAQRSWPILAQIGYSAILFGIAHGIWGIRGGWRSVAGAVGSTTGLGLALGALFVVAGRVVLPCILAHFLINLILEPWLVYAYAERASAPSYV